MTLWDNYLNEIDQPDMGWANHHLPMLNKVSEGNKILEAGAGTGILSAYLSLLGKEVVAVDNSEVAIKKMKQMKQRYDVDFQVVKADINTFKTKQKFDVILNQGFFEHLTNNEIKHTLDNLLSISNRVVFSVPSKHLGLKDVGDERLLGVKDWERILYNYNCNIFQYGGWFSIKRPIYTLKKLLGKGLHICVDVGQGII